MSKTIIPEIMPKEIPNFPLGGNLQTLTNQINTEFEKFDELEKQAAWRALRIGLLLLQAKSLLKHGEFLPWMAQNITQVRKSHAYRFMGLAQVFLRKMKLEQPRGFLLCQAQTEETIKAEPETQKLVQLSFDFIGQKSLYELFRQYQITAPTGGDNQFQKWLRENHPEFAGKNIGRCPKEIRIEWQKMIRESHAEFFEATKIPDAQAFWARIIRELGEHGLEKKDWGLLPRHELEFVYGILIDVKKQIQEALEK